MKHWGSIDFILMFPWPTSHGLPDLVIPMAFVFFTGSGVGSVSYEFSKLYLIISYLQHDKSKTFQQVFGYVLCKGPISAKISKGKYYAILHFVDNSFQPQNVLNKINILNLV